MVAGNGWSRGDDNESEETPEEREPPEGHCPKCGHEEVHVGGVSMSGGTAQRVAGVDLSQFTVVSCAHCGYSEFYRSSNRHNVVNWFFESEGSE
jgi:predicted nucleic-acid-binding Zn-ribbon protein